MSRPFPLRARAAALVVLLAAGAAVVTAAAGGPAGFRAWVNALQGARRTVVGTMAFDGLHRREERTRAYLAHLGAEQVDLRKALGADPQVRRQPRGPALGAAGYATMWGAALGPGPLPGRRPALESFRDLVQAVDLAGGNVLGAQSDLPRELDLLSAVVHRARTTGRPVPLSTVVRLARPIAGPRPGDALALAALAMHDAARQPALLLGAARELGAPPSALGLSAGGLRFGEDLSIAFFARYVEDPARAAYRLAGHQAGLPLAEAYDAIGVPYHNLDVLRLSVANGLVAPRQVGALVAFYYQPALRAIGYADAQGPWKRRQDLAAWQGALRHLDQVGGAPERPLTGSSGHVVVGTLLAVAEPAVRGLAASGLALPPSEGVGPALQVPVTGELGPDGYPTPAWLSQVQRVGPLPFTRRIACRS